MVTLDELRAKVDKLQAAQGLPATIRKEVDKARKIQQEISTDFLEVLKSTTSGLSSSKKKKESRVLLARLGMAIGGGLALVVPMLIMVLHPTEATALVMTSCFVIAAALGLAVFMADSEPKDIAACTAAYAAVLVVFVGAGGSTGFG
ncbi:hypothetical protein EDB81DRAFT_882758 [Dactylonectria macrodidyma]|uniref:DUF6594 domain-containing protein n=1 Tax=Dactylonectria macrodidyma TaxID=307937 RepID=A0A9P9EY16_9HYPO|nr:hypothetical protein EDB81DRAFT_882758 [Dactylonectria macrodidyma]